MGRPFRFTAPFLLGLAFTLILPLGGSHADDSPGMTLPWPSVIQVAGFHISAFRFSGETGLQVANVSAQLSSKSSQRLSVGLGFDEMIASSYTAYEGSKALPAISERLFLLHTSCDKRFQFTLQITW